MKIYAIMFTWEQIDWLPWAIKQLNRALSYGSLDKVLIAEGGHSKNMSGRSSDGSWEYLQKTVGNNPNYQLFDAVPFRDKHNSYDQVQPDLLNTMCNTIPLDTKEDPWIFVTQDDEFFFDKFLRDIKNIVKAADTNSKDMVMTRQLAFSFNMKLHHLNRTAYILNRWTKDSYWKPISTLCYKDGCPYLTKADKIHYVPDFDYTTFHFNRVKRVKREEMRYRLSAEINTPNAMKWHNEVWLAADLNNLTEAYKANERLTGHYGYAKDSPNTGPAMWQELVNYEGKYPEVLDDHPYKNISDIRKL